MPLVQRRGGAQAEALFDRFGIKTLGEVELLDFFLATAPIPRLDNLCAGGNALGKNAADFSKLQLFNPVDSGVVATVHRVWTAMDAAGNLSLRTHDTALATSVAFVGVLNRTRGNQPEPSCQINSDIGSIAGTTVVIWTLDIANRSYDWDLSRLGDDQKFAGPSLAEGRGFLITPSTADVSLNCGFLWSERVNE